MRGVARQALYEAALDDEDEGRLATLLTGGLGARSCIVHWMKDRPEILSKSHFTEDLIQGFQDHAHLDPWTRAAGGRLASGEAVRLSRFVSERTYLDSPFWHEFVRPAGDDTARALGVVFKTAEGLGAVALHRGLGQADFDEDAERGLQALAGDLGRILALRGRLAVAERRAVRLGENLDAFAAAVMHVAADGRLLFANAAAEAVLRREDGLSVRGGVLAAGEPGARARLAAALEAAVRTGRGDAFAAPRAEGRAAYPLTVTPLGRPGRGAAALVVLNDPDARGGPDPQMLQAFYGLTRAEAGVCRALVEGLSIGEAAEARGIRLSTARTLLKYAMAKVGVTRQGELIAKLARLSQLGPGRRPSDGGGQPPFVGHRLLPRYAS